MKGIRRINEDKLTKWDIYHLKEILTYCGKLGKYDIITINGDIIRYGFLPKWFARLWNRVEYKNFFEISRDIYNVLIGETDPNNKGFQEEYFKGSRRNLVQILFYLYLFTSDGNSVDEVKNYTTASSDKHFALVNDVPMEGIVNDKTVEVTHTGQTEELGYVHLADGPYRVSMTPFMGFIRNSRNTRPSFNELLEHLKQNGMI